MAQSYGVKEYWTERYHNDGLGDDPFDWMVGWDQLEGIVTELVPKRARILVVGCGNAPLSPDMDASGFTNAIHMDYCEVRWNWVVHCMHAHAILASKLCLQGELCF